MSEINNNPNFPTTIWSRLIITTQEKHRAEEFLVVHYWKPIFHFVRSWKLAEDPADLTQEFLTQCLSSDFLEKLQVQEYKGSFRSYLKTALRYFLLNRRDWQGAQKRKGDFSHLTFQEELMTKIPINKTAEEIFDAIWAKDFMQKCYGKLREDLLAKDQEIRFRIFYDFYLQSDRVSYQELSEKYGITVKKVTNDLNRTKSLLQKIVNEALQETVTCENELQEEIRDLKKLLQKTL